MGQSDANLTGVAGLVPFGVYLRKIGIDQELHQRFGRLKSGPLVVYPMGSQTRLLLDAFAVGETRVFGVEGLASDPLFSHLAGGVIPSIDTLYDDLNRFDEEALRDLESLMSVQGLARVPGMRRAPGTFIHLDIDTTVTPVSGEREGALPGPNPRYHGRPSFHPLLARIAETDTIVGAQLRPGDTAFGAEDIPTVQHWVARARKCLHKSMHLCVRMDAGGDCAALIRALNQEQVFYILKARISPDLHTAVAGAANWTTTDLDADENPIRQVAELPFSRQVWDGIEPGVRVIAVRSLERQGKQLPLLDGFDWTVQVFLTNRPDAADDIAWDYDGRAGIEPHIAELKGFWGLGHASCHAFAANHAAFLLKLLAHNLLGRFAHTMLPGLPRWRTAWRRRTLLRCPGRLSRSGRGRKLHLPPGSPLLQAMLE
ncbi:MAG: IS1380 family transposase [Polyangiaceae bacterium]